ncbi:MAG: TetR/AcrR family transcriptional regulator [Ruminococcus sp.]|nr:TetR/AcrR family transcriptional regulator [Ruminococcus sp.]
MPERSNDRRAQKTRKALASALSELLTQKELHKITVQELCDKAELNRGTLYRHYLDVYDLYEKIEKETVVDLALLLLDAGEQPTAEFFKKIIEYISQNKSIFRMVFSPNTTGQLRTQLSGMIKGIFQQKQIEKGVGSLSENDLNYMCSYRAQGCLAIISDWVTGDFKESEDFIIKTISLLDSNTEKVF